MMYNHETNDPPLFLLWLSAVRGVNASDTNPHTGKGNRP